MAPDSLAAAEAVETPRLTFRRLHELKCGIGAPPTEAELRAAEEVRRRVAEQMRPLEPVFVAVASEARRREARAAPARQAGVRRPLPRPREHRSSSRRRGARAPGRPSADDGDADGDGPPLRRCRACGEPFRPRRSDSSYCYRADCRRRRAALKVRRLRERRAQALPLWAEPERRAVAAVRAGLAEPAEALAALVAGLVARGELAPAEALR